MSEKTLGKMDPAQRIVELEREVGWEGWRRFFGLTPHIPEGRATFDALVPERYKRKPENP